MQHAELVIILAGHRAGVKAAEQAAGKGWKKTMHPGDASSKPTLEQLFNSRIRGTRFKALGKLPIVEVRLYAACMHTLYVYPTLYVKYVLLPWG
jgi:hypothetical protein